MNWKPSATERPIRAKRVSVESMRLQCPECGVPINICEAVMVGGVAFVDLEPCGHTVEAESLTSAL